jgi:hypothetical protein
MIVDAVLSRHAGEQHPGTPEGVSHITNKSAIPQARKEAVMNGYELLDGWHREQIFDPPYSHFSIAGVPICELNIPRGRKKYRSFLAWWFAVGRLHPEDPQDFGTLSGPWVMDGRVEAISPEEWSKLPEHERQLIVDWARQLPIVMFYD